MKLFERFRAALVVELVDLYQDRLMFQTRRKFGTGETTRVKLALSEGPFQLTVRIVKSRPLSLAGFLYTAQCHTTIPRPDGPGLFSNPGVRKPGRVTCRMRVCSPDLPGFQVMSRDFSRAGLQVEAREELTPGKIIPVSLHIEMANLQVVACKARIAWCGQESRGCWRVGLEFTECPPSTRAQLEKFHELLTAREQLSGDDSCSRLWGSEDHVLGDKSKRLIDGHWTRD